LNVDVRGSFTRNALKRADSTTRGMVFSMGEGAVWLIFGLAAVTFLALSFIIAPYGRHLREGFGPSIPARSAWLMMECPAVLGMPLFFVFGAEPFQPAAMVLIGLWLLHYVQRTFVFPFRLRGTRRMPVLIAALGFGFNVFNGWLNGRALSTAGRYSASWLFDLRFIVGAAVFLVGLAINWWADGVLRNLRTPADSGYRIPRGGLYEFISCPNYFGELLEWFGFALAAWSLSGLAFAFYTAANLVPRAAAHHRWYQEHFPNYPPSRRALIPRLW
jgi:3-oxo-5-alpha-steroid 4-dehydrogenase 1